jgi:hypothetical protein
MRDLKKYSEVTVGEIDLLKVGRHFRLSPSSKMVVGRNEKENRRLARLAREGDLLFEPIEGVNGPLGLGRRELSKEEIQKGAGLVARYCDRTENEKVIVITRKLPAGREHPIQVNGMLDELIEEYRI